MRRLLGLGTGLIAILLIACGDAAEETPLPPPVPSTYHRDIAPLVQEKCGGCHVEGGIAPFPLQNYEQVFAMRGAIKASVKARIMPPWMPARDCTEYQQDRSLSDEQIALISRWVEEGGAEGDPVDEPTVPRVSQGGLSRADLTLAMPEAYSPTQSPDEYRCFVLDWPETATRYISGFRGNPGRPSIVHHVIAFLAKPDEVATYQALDDADPKPGYTCFGGPGLLGNTVSWIGSWVPGSGGMDYPDGTGIQVEPGSKIVLQVHYNLSSANAAADTTSVSVRLESSVQKVAIMQPWTNPSWRQSDAMLIPAGQADVRYRFSFDLVPLLSNVTRGVFVNGVPITVYSAGLHMHTLGSWGRMEIERKTGGTDCMLDIPRWDFHWQGSYAFAQPKVLTAGDRMAIECHWDNSLPMAQDVMWGEGTEDEMCLGTFYMTQ
ncbi:monooxygenase [Hyalangium versicolor]|uniref:monooxygenase n=1 Tax=Hyalangium versicolor TaxID=2861190 RepID=UPI001CCCC838|nr:hypothetical protein [Hyalangium versicolor]